MKALARIASRIVMLGVLALPFLLVLALAFPRSTPGYLLRQGIFQARMLWYRVPVADALAGRTDGEIPARGDLPPTGTGAARGALPPAGAPPALTPQQLQRLALVPHIKAFGEELGLAASDHYETINPRWDHVVWNVSACEELAFRPRTWQFPIVGTVPYLGYFERADALEQADLLRGEGLDVQVRTAGAFSSLGWYAMPILPNMLEWSEYRLADTLLHEITHATLWVPGSVQFNESFANFVGEQAALRYVAARYGADSEELRAIERNREDGERFRQMLHGLFLELEALYADPTLTASEKRMRKHMLLAALPTRTAALDLHEPDRWLAHVRRTRWNNATLMGFRRYNRSPEWFAALLDEQEGDLEAFVDRVGELTREADDPYVAIARAVGAEEPLARDSH